MERLQQLIAIRVPLESKFCVSPHHAKRAEAPLSSGDHRRELFDLNKTLAELTKMVSCLRDLMEAVAVLLEDLVLD